MNQKLALRLLERMGYAGRRRRATASRRSTRSRRADYDVVLMDVQMPELDGLEATRRIRGALAGAADPRSSAMTANAMAGDREACLAAGHGRLRLQADPARGSSSQAIAAAAPASARTPHVRAPRGPAWPTRPTPSRRSIATRDRPGPRRRRHPVQPPAPAPPPRAGSATSARGGRRAARPSTCSATRRREPVDVILLDIVMPEMDGYETLAALKADEALRDLPVIVISGVDELDSVVRCIEMGAADYLPKTVDPAILRARIAASLGQKRLRDQERALLGTIDRQRSQLARFLSPQVAALVSSPDGEAMLAGHRREITAMFCDLRNFTTFSETAEPEEVLGFLRLYHATLGELDRRPRGDARALRRRRDHGLLQRPGPPGRPRRSGRSGSRSTSASGSRTSRPTGAGAATSSRSGSGSRPATRRWAGSASRAATTTAASATRSSSPRA